VGSQRDGQGPSGSILTKVKWTTRQGSLVGIESGYFFITDITGYTRFLTQSELDHATEILDAIFDSMRRHVEAPLAVSKVEGRAIAPTRRVELSGVTGTALRHPSRCSEYYEAFRPPKGQRTWAHT